MFIDYLSVQLAAAAAGLFFAAVYGVFYIDSPLETKRSWATFFWVIGAVLMVTGLDTVTHWPLPGGYNIVFGEPALFFGAVLFGAGFGIRWGDNLVPISFAALVGGVINILISIDMLKYSMTREPVLAFWAYLTSGVGAVLVPPAIGLKGWAWLRWIVGILLVISAILFAITGIGAYLQHPHSFAKWKP